LPTDLATSLTRHRITPTTKAREEVVELCELDLGLTFAGLGVLGEDIEDHRGPVNHLDLDGVFERAALARGELGVCNNSVCPNGHDDLVKFLDLSATKIGGWVWVRLPLKHTVEHNRSCRLAQRSEFLHRILCVFLVPLGIDPNQYDILDTELAVFDLGDIFEFGSKAVDAAEGDAVCEVHFANGGAVGLIKFVCHVPSGYAT
jgi:hypothetical protein